MAKDKFKIKRIFFIIFVVILAFAIRIYPIKNTSKGDLLVHYEWSQTIYKEGLENIYFFPTWTYTPPTQPPLMMMGFWTSRHLYENRYLLSELHNQTRLPPSSVILCFDKYGEYLLLRLWAILGDFLSAFFVFFLIKKYLKNFNIALLGLIFMLFNPISLMETSLWGQNDVIGIIFAYISFLLLKNKSWKIFSPLIFLISLLIKPTSLVLFPFFAYLYLFSLKDDKKKIRNILVPFFLCLSFVFLSFKPFINASSSPVPQIYNIINNRITSSSKGTTRASNSAFNIYSLFFELDKTPGSYRLLGLELNSLSLIAYIAINIFSIYLFGKNNTKQPLKLFFIIFFISQGTFLLVTGMLERYFFPAFISSVLLMFLSFKNFGYLMILQNLLWLLNLFYAYFQRDVGWVKELFEDNSLFLVRIISLISLVNFYAICRKYFQIKEK
ncbi:hypothetical protein KKD37_02020 [Patescibacteria group bacterium]|nr:hypothetical protein [Patescibacteria group bacterium]